MRNELDLFAQKYGTDKRSSKHYYTKWYNNYFRDLRDKKINILEIGIKKGASVLMWRDYFKNGNVFGIDIEDHKSYSRKLKGIKCFIGDASDDSFLSKVESKVAGGFDIIIDDASHEPSHQISGFECLFSKLNKGGIYVVEDLHTSYENKDISSYINAVDYFKRLVDEVNFNGKNKYQNFNRIKEEIMKESTYYERTIESICFHMGICFIFKRKV